MISHPQIHIKMNVGTIIFIFIKDYNHIPHTCGPSTGSLSAWICSPVHPAHTELCPVTMLVLQAQGPCLFERNRTDAD